MDIQEMAQTHARKEKIAVIGLGYVGLPLAQLCVEKGLSVIGIDIDKQKIEQLYNHRSYLTDLTDLEIKKMFDSKLFTATIDFSKAHEADYLVICVPTPLDHKEPDVSYIISAIESILPHLRRTQLVVLESSTYPGTTEELILPMLEKQGWKVGKDFFLGYSPERIDPGNEEIAYKDMPKVISGMTSSCQNRMNRLYSLLFTKVVPVSSPRTAEFVKMLENSQRLINISFINELNLLAQKMQIDIWEVIEAAKTKPIGFAPYYPSPGAGGHCIPVDPFFLSWIADQKGIPLSMIKKAGEINDRMPEVIANRVLTELKDRNIDILQSKVGIIGLTYKKDVNDIRESAALKVVHLLMEKQINIYAYDPLYANMNSNVPSFYLTKDQLQMFDVVLILVDHSKISWKDVVDYSNLVIDTRNVTRNIHADHIIRL